MIRLRKANGDILTLPADVQFVEVTDSDGRVGSVFFLDSNKTVGVFGHGTEEARRYKRLYPNVEFCSIVEPTK